MTLPLILMFLTCFVAGPSLCALLLRLPGEWPTMLGIGTLGLICAWVAVFLPNLNPRLILWSLAALWLAWVLCISLAGLAFKKRAQSYKAQRWITFIALLATPLPWFGLATARTLL